MSFHRVLSLVSSSSSCNVSTIISFLIGFDGVVVGAVAGVAEREAAFCEAKALSRLDRIDARAFARSIEASTFIAHDKKYKHNEAKDVDAQASAISNKKRKKSPLTSHHNKDKKQTCWPFRHQKEQGTRRNISCLGLSLYSLRRVYRYGICRGI